MFRNRILAGLLALACAGAAGAEPKTAEEIDACVRSNQPDVSSVQTIAFYAEDRIKAINESRAKMYWKRFDDGLSKVMMRFSLPADLRGAGVLLIEKKGGNNDMFMYLPELDKVKRITNRMISGSMFGTDFSWEDFERLQGLSEDSALERLADARLGEKSVYVISSSPRRESGSAYLRVVNYVDPETCVPLKTEFFEAGDRLRKVATVDPEQVTREGDDWIPRELLMRDLRDETETRLVVEEMEVGVEIARKMFSSRELEAGGR